MPNRVARSSSFRIDPRPASVARERTARSASTAEEARAFHPQFRRVLEV
jgi:hypothetical protein